MRTKQWIFFCFAVLIGGLAILAGDPYGILKKPIPDKIRS